MFYKNYNNCISPPIANVYNRT